MSRTSGKIIGELAPWAILGVGALIIIKNPAIIGNALNWLYNAVPGGQQQQAGGGGGGGQTLLTTVNLPGVGNTQAISDPNILAFLSMMLGTPNPNWWPTNQGSSPAPNPSPAPKVTTSAMPGGYLANRGNTISTANYNQFRSDFISGQFKLTPQRVIKTSSVPLAVNANGSMYPGYSEARKLILQNPVNRAAALRDPMYGIAYP